MTDDDKDKNTPPEDHHDEFEEEFAFDTDISDSDDFLQDEQEGTEAETQTPQAPKPKGGILPLIIGLVILGFIGWKAYRYFFPKIPSIENAQITPVPDNTPAAVPENAPIKLPSQEMPPELSAQGINHQAPVQPITPAPSTSTTTTPLSTPSQPATTPSQTPVPSITPPSSTLLPTPAQPSQTITPSQTAPAPSHPQTPSTVLPSASSTVVLPLPKNDKALSATEQPSKAPFLSQAPKTGTPAAESTATLPHRAQVSIQEPNQGGIGKLEQKMDEQEQFLKKHLQGLEKDLAQNAATAHRLDNLQNDINSLSNAVRILTEQLKNLKEPPRPKRQEQAKAEKPKKQHQQAQRTEANPSLCVYAIIPGRAWLKTSSGKTITVSEGDTIAEFGRVLKIDAGNAYVVTSSGIILR